MGRETQKENTGYEKPYKRKPAELLKRALSAKDKNAQDTEEVISKLTGKKSAHQQGDITN